MNSKRGLLSEREEVEFSESPQILAVGEVLPTWIPVIFGILTPMCFTTNGILLRKLTSPKYGINFNGTTMSFTTYFIVNLLILIFAAFFWQSHHFSKDLFWLGTIGSIINTVGISCLNTAITKGPMGPVSSIAALSNIMLVIEEAIRL